MKLVHHPDFPLAGVGGVAIDWRPAYKGCLSLTYRVDGAVPSLPQATSPGRADNLWQATCFELFLKPLDGTGYVEFNFSPSGQWAAYGFDGYRQGMCNLVLARDPVVAVGAREGFTLDVEIDLSGIWTGPMKAAFTAILIEQDGTKSYWSLAHSAGKPDFHDPACFVLELPAPRLP